MKRIRSLASIAYIGLIFASAGPALADEPTARTGKSFAKNWHIARWVLGTQGDLSLGRSIDSLGLSSVQGPTARSPSVTPSLNRTWDATASGSAGYLLNERALIYTTGGIAFEKSEEDSPCPADRNLGACGTNISALGPPESAATTRSGWTAGGGVEFTLRNNWRLRGEYRFEDYSSTEYLMLRHPAVSGNVDAWTSKRDVNTHSLSVGLAHRF